MSEPKAKAPPRCPICGKPRDVRFRPFCSRRCRAVDLGRWFNQTYAIPAPLPEEDDEAEEGEGRDGDATAT
jgi:uncharacterized protein